MTALLLAAILAQGSAAHEETYILTYPDRLEIWNNSSHDSPAGKQRILLLKRSAITLDQAVTMSGALTLSAGLSGTTLGLSDALTLSDGAIIDQSANGVFTFTEGGETFELTVTNNLGTWASTTSATFAFTPAVGFTGDATFSGGAGAVTFSDSASSIVIPNNDASALDIGGSGLTTLMRLDTTTDAQQVILGAGLRGATTDIAAATALDASDCGKSFAVTAGIDTFSITLPDADAVRGCELTFSYVGADGGALVDITPLDSDADGIEGGCYETTTDTVVYFSGTADADIGLTKASALTGDYIKLHACGDAMWCVVGCQGIWANN